MSPKRGGVVKNGDQNEKLLHFCASNGLGRRARGGWDVSVREGAELSTDHRLMTCDLAGPCRNLRSAQSCDPR